MLSKLIVCGAHPQGTNAVSSLRFNPVCGILQAGQAEQTLLSHVIDKKAQGGRGEREEGQGEGSREN